MTDSTIDPTPAESTAPTSDPSPVQPQEPGAPETNDAAGQTDSSPEGSDSTKDELTPEQLRDALAKARKDAANYRTQLRSVEDQLGKRKTDEDVDALVAEIKTEREEAERALTRENVALKYGLPDELSEVLQGKTREEMEEHAKKLQKFAQVGEVRGEGSGGLDPTSKQEAFDPEATYAAIKASRRR